MKGILRHSYRVFLVIGLLAGCVSSFKYYEPYYPPQTEQMIPYKNEYLEMHICHGWEEIVVGKEEGTTTQFKAPYSELHLLFGGLTPVTSHLTILHVEPSVSDDRAFAVMRRTVDQDLAYHALIKGPYKLPVHSGNPPVFEVHLGKNMVGFDTHAILAVKRSNMYDWKYVIYAVFVRIRIQDDLYSYEDFLEDCLDMIASIK